ncbi:hypothetical protein N665_1303s0008 [Sinapis alba]|nr:hypothetical protein N665_1303s0008 [Sinapis alba]
MLKPNDFKSYDGNRLVEYELDTTKRTKKNSGLPKHEFTLKVSVVVMCMCNLDSPNGLCNSTMLMISNISHHAVEAVIMTRSARHTYFSRGQLYVALSRIKSRSGLKIIITNEKDNVQKKTTNIVYKEVFQNISEEYDSAIKFKICNVVDLRCTA